MIVHQGQELELVDVADRRELAEMLRWSRTHAPGLIHFAADPDPIGQMRKAYKVVRPAIEGRPVGR